MLVLFLKSISAICVSHECCRALFNDDFSSIEECVITERLYELLLANGVGVGYASERLPTKKAMI